MLHARVDIDGGGQAHILFEKGSLRELHYHAEPENERNSHFTVHRIDSMLFWVGEASHRSFRIDIEEASSDTFLQVRVRMIGDPASMNFAPDGLQAFHISPGEDKTLIYSKASGANARINT